MNSSDYLASILKWRMDLDTQLRGENDWLAAAGLYWLKKGNNTFGSSRDCDIIFPKEAPRLLGAFELNDASAVTLHLDLGQSAELNGQPIQNAVPVPLHTEDAPNLVKFGNLSIAVFHRADKVGLRLWDNRREERRSFPPRAWYPVDETYRIPGLYTPYPMPMKFKMFNASGEWEENYFQGYVSFNLRGRTYNLDASDHNDGSLFIQFTDLTNGKKTHSKGRYLYTEIVEEDGRVFLDFNKAFNPPSAFSNYSTCTFPPSQNHINAALEAGELFTPPA